MSEQGRLQSNTSAHERQVLLDGLLRQGFSPEEADLALRDAGVPPQPAVEYPPAVPRAPWATAASGHGAPGHPPTGRSFAGDAGQTSYRLGLLAWLPIPLFSALIAGVAMAAALPGQRRRSPLAGENARRAANWGLTYALGAVLSVVTTIILELATGEEGPAARDASPWQLWFLSPILVLSVGHLVVTVVGLKRTSRGEAFRAPGVPFFRAVDLDPEVARLFDARRARASGASVYAWGLLALVPLFGASAVVAGLSMAAAYRWRRGASPLAARNGREAANWGLTLASLAGSLLVALSLTGYLGGPGNDGIVIVGLALVALHVLHLVVVVRGLRKAARGEVLHNPLAVPFLRIDR